LQVLHLFAHLHESNLRSILATEEIESKAELENFSFKFDANTSALSTIETLPIFLPFENEVTRPSFVQPSIQKQWFDMIVRIDGVLQTMIFAPDYNKVLLRSKVDKGIPQQYLCVTEPLSQNIIWTTVHSCCIYALSTGKKDIFLFQIASNLYIYVTILQLHFQTTACLVTYYTSHTEHASEGVKKYLPTLKSERGEILSHVEIAEHDASNFSADVYRELVKTINNISDSYPSSNKQKKKKKSTAVNFAAELSEGIKQNPLIFESSPSVDEHEPQSEEPNKQSEDLKPIRPIRHYTTTFSVITPLNESTGHFIPKPPPLLPIGLSAIAPKPPSQPNTNTFVRKTIFEHAKSPQEKTELVELTAGEDINEPSSIADLLTNIQDGNESNEKIFYQRES
jgi:hypothetical protein